MIDFFRYCKDAETLQEEDFEGYEGNGSVCPEERGRQIQKQEGGWKIQKQPSQVGAPLRTSSPPSRASGRCQTTKRGRGVGSVEIERQKEGESAWTERRYSLPVDDQSWEASARWYAPGCQGREQMRGRGRGRGSCRRFGVYQRHLPPRLLRQSRADTREEESVVFQDVQAPQVKSTKLGQFMKF